VLEYTLITIFIISTVSYSMLTKMCYMTMHVWMIVTISLKKTYYIALMKALTLLNYPELGQKINDGLLQA